MKKNKMSKRKDRAVMVELRVKKVNALERELRSIHDAQRNLGYIVLDKPLRDGWYRTFELRRDIQKHKRIKAYREILKLVAVKIWGREKKYADRAWDKHFRKSLLLFQRPGIRFIEEKEYETLSSVAKKYFKPILIKTYYRYKRKYYCTLPRYYFVTSYERAYITKRKIIAPELERREQEIRELLKRPELFHITIYYPSRYRGYCSSYKRKRRQTNMALQAVDIDRLEQLLVRNTRS